MLSARASRARARAALPMAALAAAAAATGFVAAVGRVAVGALALADGEALHRRRDAAVAGERELVEVAPKDDMAHKDWAP